MVRRVGDRIRQQLGDGFHQSQMVGRVGVEFRRVDGQRAQRLAILDERRDGRRAVSFARFDLHRLEINRRVAVVHRVVVGDDPAADAKARRDAFATKAFSVAARDVHGLDFGGVLPHQIKNACRVANNVEQARGKDRKGVTQVEARADGLRDVIKRQNFAVSAANLLVSDGTAFVRQAAVVASLAAESFDLRLDAALADFGLELFERV